MKTDISAHAIEQMASRLKSTYREASEALHAALKSPDLYVLAERTDRGDLQYHYPPAQVVLIVRDATVVTVVPEHTVRGLRAEMRAQLAQENTQVGDELDLDIVVEIEATTLSRLDAEDVVTSTVRAALAVAKKQMEKAGVSVADIRCSIVR